jgi:hypothetical protein
MSEVLSESSQRRKMHNPQSNVASISVQHTETMQHCEDGHEGQE